jgi:regulation of enolase protein 1 (concanavalin A-like superfamily)
MKFPLSALDLPDGWRLDEPGTLTALAPAATDLFVDPAGDPPALSAPRALFAPPAGDWQLSARVRVEFAGTYDAGVLLVWSGDRHWAKLCFELSPQGRPTIVTVVTRGESDDANGFTVDGAVAWLRVTRHGSAWAFHASTDGSYWHLIRYFALGTGLRVGVEVGFEAQSPVGAGCTVTFDEVRLVSERLADLRNGT